MSNYIGLNIKKYREEKGLTQEELANEIGKSLRTVQKYESGDILPSFDNVHEITKILGISCTDIIGDIDKYTASDVDRSDKKEMVNHPSHYNQGIEAIDYIESHKMNFNIGNVIKYVTRAKHKGTELEDLKKASWYLNREIERLEKGE